MNVTSDCLFHFTTSLKNLENILSRKFKLTYCQESYSLDGKEYGGNFPMLSFCDLPLSLAKAHIGKYGEYAIGLTKSWGIKNNLNPVVYCETNSTLSKDLRDEFEVFGDMLDTIQKILKNQKKIQEKDVSKLIDAISHNVDKHLNLMRYIKNYQGTLERGSKKYHNYRFYDEREWRYIPPIDDSRVKPNMSESDYKVYRGAKSSKPLIEDITLSFSGTDIKYLIVQSTKDIPAIIRRIGRTDNLVKNADDADILTTKIITIDQLHEDF